MPVKPADLCLSLVDGAPCLLAARHPGEHISILTPGDDEVDEEIGDDEDEGEDESEDEDE